MPSTTHPLKLRTQDDLKADKGKVYNVVGGAYDFGTHVWRDVRRKPNEAWMPVIVLVQEKDEEGLVTHEYLSATKLLKTNIVEAPTREPKNRAEAVLDQQPKIRSQLHKLCQELAKCGLNDQGADDIDKIFVAMRLKYAKLHKKKTNKMVYEIHGL